MSLLCATGSIVEAETLYKQIFEIGFRPGDSTIPPMISLYGRFHKLIQAQETFACISYTSSFMGAAYNSMIGTYCKCGEIDKAIQLYEEMVGRGYTQDAVTISILVNVLTKNSEYFTITDLSLITFIINSWSEE